MAPRLLIRPPMAHTAFAPPLVTTPSGAPTIAVLGDRVGRIERGLLVTSDLDGADRAAAGSAHAVVALGAELWAIDEHATAVTRHDGRGALLGSPIAIGAPSLLVAAHRCDADPSSLVVQNAEGAALVTASGATRLGPIREAAIPIPGGVVTRSGRRIVVRSRACEQALPVPLDLATSTRLAGGAALAAGELVAVELVGARERHVIAVDLARRQVCSRICVSGAIQLAWVDDRAHVVVARTRELVVIDLATGRHLASSSRAAPVARLALDAAGSHLVVEDPAGALAVHDYLALIGAPPRAPATADVAPAPATAVTDDAPAPELADGEARAAADAERPPARDREPAAADAGGGEALEVGGPLLALAPPPFELDDDALRAYLDDAYHLVAAYARTAMAAAWNSGRLAHAEPGGLPFAGELAAALGGGPERAPAQLAEARAAEHQANERFARWGRPGAPHVEIARDLGLSSSATTILLLAAAPLVWGELARIYAVIANDRARPLVDELLLATLLEADPVQRRVLADELDEGAPLRRWGAIAIGPGARPFAPLEVHPAIVRRLAGGRRGSAHAEPVRPRRLGELHAPHAALAGLVRALSSRRSPPARVVLRGRPGSGRRTIAASLAALAGRTIAEVAAPARDDLEALLRVREGVRAAALRGELPCVTVEGARDGALDARLAAALADHPGALFVRTDATTPAPLAPGYLELALPSMSEAARAGAFAAGLTERGLPPDAAPALARRFDVGPGTIARALDELAPAGGDDVAERVTAALRQRRGGQLAKIATRVERLATWGDLILPDDALASLRELVARVRHRRTVLEDWGMDRVIATSRGVTALLQGLPGTGKTMTAGVLARELGCELWRIDLSRVLSKWMGETEKNLATVFDAAEDGDVILLFDEADSLFGKRTEVSSSNDRHANLETNYLLQRLDAFEGLAVLTTNLGTAIDPAFRRRLSLQLQLPFPDEEERERLWRAHLPSTVPTRGELDLARLARTYQLSGGYIRNAAVRACYLAASVGEPVTMAHLAAAVQAEYRDRAKIASGGKLE